MLLYLGVLYIILIILIKVFLIGIYVDVLIRIKLILVNDV